LSLTADGKRASFLQWGLEDAIHIVDLDAEGNPSGSTRLTFSQGRNIPSGWTADNQSVVFVSDGRGSVALVRQSVGADSPQTLADEPGIVGAARLTPDGAAVLYLVMASRPGAAGRVMRVAVAGGPAKEIVSGKFIDGGARCAVAPATVCATAERSDDGRQIVFRSIEFSNTPRRELARADADADSDFRWALSPDGVHIAFLDTRKPVIEVLSLAGSPPMAIDVKRQGRLGYLSWTGDGNGLLVPSLDPKGATLMSIDLRGNIRVVAQHAAAVDISGIPSPDGRRVAVWVRSLAGSLWVAEIP
jgi:Tol biopolymer transport system component